MSVDTSDLVQQVTDYAAGVRDVALDTVLADCQAAAPVSPPDPVRPSHIPGALRDSLKIEDVADALTVFTGSIVSDLPYAQWTDDVDTPPHEISTSLPSLVFWWDDGPNGPDIYRYKRVHHPGTTGQKWFADPMAERWDRALNDALA